MLEKSHYQLAKTALAIAISSVIVGHAYAQAPSEEGAGVLEEIIVTGVRQSQAQSIDIKRNSKTVVDSIVAEDIGKLPDTTITDSLQRVAGVQINREAGEGTTLNVRGMPQVLTTFNGEQFLSPWSITGIQANYSDIPAGMISGVDVYKSQSASTLAGGISGVVDLKTLDPSTLPEGFTGRARIDAGLGSHSYKEYDTNGDDSYRDPDHSVTLVGGFNSGEGFSVLANVYSSNTYAANYSMWESHHLAFLNEEAGRPWGDLSNPYPTNADGSPDYSYVPSSWYIVPEEYNASSSFVERDRTGGSITAKFDFNDFWSVRGDVFYTEMDKYERNVRAGFSGRDTPDSYEVNGTIAKRKQKVFDVLQEGTIVSDPRTLQYKDRDGNIQTVSVHSLQVADVFSSEFQATTQNTIEKTAALNTNIELTYNNNDNLKASVRAIHATAEKQMRLGRFQQGTPAWEWVDIDGISGKDPVDGYQVKVDYRGSIPSFEFVGDLADTNILKQYQGFAEGENTDAELNVIRGDVTFTFDNNHFESVDAGLRYGKREANHNKFFYVTPTGRYTNWEDPRVPVDKRYKLLPGNLVWQKFPDWLRFDYETTNSSLITVGGLQDNGFTSAETYAFRDFGPIKGFETGIAALDPKAWDNPYEFMNRLYPGTRTVNDPGFTYGVEEETTNAYVQFNFANDVDGIFGIPYNANVGVQAVRTERAVEKSVIPDVLDSFNSIGYNDWQKIAYVYDTQVHTHSDTSYLPSLNINLFPTDDVVLRFGVSKTQTRNDLHQLGSSMTVWLSQCGKTDESGAPVMVLDPSTGSAKQDTVGCVAGGEDKGNPYMKPWEATVINFSSEWYFAENSIIGLGLFNIQVDTSVEDFQESRPFLDMDGIDRGRRANINTTRNVGASDLWGVELGYKQPFNFFDNAFLNSTGIEFNYTYSHSETDMVDMLGEKLPLPNNSEHQSNLILWYDNHGLNVRIAYNYRSEEYLGRAGVNTSVAVMEMARWYEPTGYLDLSISYDINEHFNLFFNGTNLTEENRKSYAQFENQFHSLWVQEARYNLGVNVSF